LRRRKVVQWSLGYVAVAWGLLQALEFAVGTFDWPILLTRVAAVVAVTGLPLVLTVAWFHGDRGEQRVTRLEAFIVATLLLVGAFAAMRVANYPIARHVDSAAGSTTSRQPARKSVDRLRLAVLPFENLGGDPGNAAFASGVHDTLIAQIARIPGLAVISRSSVMQFEGRHPTIRQVAEALAVGSVVEGSIARDGKRVRIQAQLIDSVTDTHLWSETYDRTSDDLFAVQNEIALAVAEQLRVRLTRDSAERLKASLTGNPEAYEHYVLGRSHAMRGDTGRAIEEFTTATTLDPRFAAAYAQLGMAYTWGAFADPRRRDEYLPLAKLAVDQAVGLDPTLPETHLARGVFLYRGAPDLDLAAAEFEMALAGSPNDVQALRNFGLLRRWQGRWDEAAALFKRGAELDPGGPVANLAANILAAVGRRDEAGNVIASAMAARPEDVQMALIRADLAADMDCDLRSAESVIDDVLRRFPNRPEPWGISWYFALQTGDWQRAIDAAEHYVALAGDDDDSGHWRLGAAELAAGRAAEGRSWVEQSLRQELDRARHMPGGDALAQQLVWIAFHYSALGQHQRAVEYASRALRELPPTGAAYQRAEVLRQALIVYERAGDTKTSRRLLQEALTHPAPYRASGIWCDSMLADARRDAGFRQAIEEHGGNTAIDPSRRETWPSPVWLTTPVH
jgi:TolB-like protein/Tfp pilus assembly protein PilF